MKKIIACIVCLALSLVCVRAETIVLRTGVRVQGTIAFQNEEVVIVRDAQGARFQYPREEVQEILPDETEVAAAQPEETEPEEEIRTAKKVSALLELSGGAAMIPNELTGGGVGVDLIIGTHHIGNKHLFIGGGLGYHGVFVGGEKYNFLPFQVALRMPFTEEKHAPVFGVALGYGLALSKNYIGGLYAGIDFGYRCQLNPKSAISITAFARFQQAKLTVSETIDGEVFAHKTGRNLLTPGIKLALYF